jgi:wobble nucleotide-excising tRNase
MSMTIAEIAQQLRASNKRVHLIYAFNGTGKTRLSREFKQLIASNVDVGEDVDGQEPIAFARNKILYYNAFTEDLFYWDNDLTLDTEPKMIIQPNSFTDWVMTVLKDLGQDRNIVTTFQRYTSVRLMPLFGEDFRQVTFSLQTGDNAHSGNLKISKGEESVFIWSVFYALLDQVIEVLNVPEPTDRETSDFDKLEYVFIDDPVSSLDDNHLIELAVDLAQRVKKNESPVRFIVTTHNPLFFNVLCNELGSDDKTEHYNWKSKWFSKSRLDRLEDGSHQLIEQPNDSPFAYHLHLISMLEKVIESGQIEKYHFNLLRNILEKTATFLGYKRWEHLLPETPDGLPSPYAKRIVNFSSHSKHAAEEVQPLKTEEKKVLENLVKHVVANHRFWQEKTT